MTGTSPLLPLLAAEHAAIYGYGVLGARLDDLTRREALRAYDAHRAARDDLQTRLRTLGVDAPGPLPAYDAHVGSAPQAIALAVHLEQGLGVLWRDLAGGTDEPGLRRLAVTGLQGTALRAATWRRLGGARPGTVALPGVDPAQAQPSTTASSPSRPGSSASGTTS